MTADGWQYGRMGPKKPQSKWALLHQKKDEIDIESLDFSDLENEPALQGEDEGEVYETVYDSPADLWSDFVDVSPVNWHLRKDVFFHEQPARSREVMFGFEIGSLFRKLRPEHEEEVPGTDLIWGFILGFIGQSNDDVKDREEELLQQLILDLETRQQERQEEAELMPPPDEISAELQEMDELTIRGVEEAGITPHPIVVREVAFHQPTRPDDGDLHKKTATRIVRDIAELVPLREIDEIASDATHDIENLHNQNTRGIDRIESVVEFLWAEAGSHTSNTIGGALDKDSGSVSRFLNRVSPKDDYELLTEKPLVEEESEQSSRDGWKLTGYGKVVSYSMFENQEDTDWIYRFAIGPEELTLQERKLAIDALDYLDFMEA